MFVGVGVFVGMGVSVGRGVSVGAGVSVGSGVGVASGTCSAPHAESSMANRTKMKTNFFIGGLLKTVIICWKWHPSNFLTCD